MFYYPHLLKTPNLVNLQVVVPGGWGELKSNEAGLHFLWEALLFAPTENISDPDKWLWEHTLDFWSVTSYESIRLNFTLRPEQIKAFAPVLKTLLQPRKISPEYTEQELNDLKHYWQTDRHTAEDTVIRSLFPNENVVHPNRHLIDQLTLEHAANIQTLWTQAQPHLIILGYVSTEDLVALGQVFPDKTEISTVENYESPQQARNFFLKNRWGLKVELNQSHLFELLLIELWEQQFKAQFFFEYHQADLFIWTNEQEYPRVLAQKVLNYVLTEADFKLAQTAYTQFLKALMSGATQKSLEKLAELTEGFHAHPYQSPTFGVDSKTLNLADTIQDTSFTDFAAFYEGFLAPIKKDHSTERS